MNRTISINENEVESSNDSLPSPMKIETMILSIHGHLFDSGLINHVLDVIEYYGHGVIFEQCTFPPQSSRTTTKSSVILRIDGSNVKSLHNIERKIKSLIELTPKADAQCDRLDYNEPEDNTNGIKQVADITVEEMKKEKKVLLLGAGRVSKSFVEFLGRTNKGCIITVASDNEDDAKDVASAALNGRPVCLDIMKNVHRLSEMVEESDLVVSLLPATMHVPIALDCILHQKHFITASYENDDMRSLGERAKNAGIIILNEVGLDPGKLNFSVKDNTYN
jgi:alpha-aminoadipic semialdehyde synthase